MKTTYAYFPASPNSPKHDSSRPCYPPSPQHALSKGFPHFSPRSCTDIICCVLFFLFILGYIAVGLVGEFLAVQSWAVAGGHYCPKEGPHPRPFPLKSLLHSADSSVCLCLQPGCMETPSKSSTPGTLLGPIAGSGKTSEYEGKKRGQEGGEMGDG